MWAGHLLALTLHAYSIRCLRLFACSSISHLVSQCGKSMCNSVLMISIEAYFTAAEVSLCNGTAGKLQEVPYVPK